MKKPLTNKFGDVRELTEKDFKDMKPFPEGLPSEFVNTIKTRGKQKSPTKQAVQIRLSKEVIEYFKADGKGWQTRIDKALKEYIQQ